MPEQGRHRFAVYGRFLRLPFLLAAPGLPLAGFLLAGGEWAKCPPYAFLSVCGSAVFSSIFAETGFSAGDTASLAPDTRRTIRIASFLLTLLFSSFRAETFTAASLILLTGLAAPKIAAVTFLGAACTGLRFVFLAALGMALLPMTGMSSFLPCADFFAIGLFLFVYGLEEARGLRTLRPSTRPGGLPLILGAGVCYLSVFLRLGRMDLHGFFPYVCGFLAALSAGIFFILAWKAWKVFRQKSLPGIVKRWTDSLRINLIFIQAGAAAAAGAWKISILLLACTAAAHAIHTRIEREAGDGC